MKTILSKLFFISILAGLFSSCKKDENRIYFEGGTAPVLAASSTSALVLTGANASNQAIRFDWTNPDYMFTTGISSQDVLYVLQVDTTGSNFTSPTMQEISVARELATSFTVKELNAVMTKLEMLENIPHNIEFRLKASLANNTVPLFSNVIQVIITPYLDVVVPIPPSGELYITGSAMPSDWTNSPPLAQKCVKVSNTEYYITVALASGGQYKFLSTLGAWQPQYGGSSATGGDIGYNMGGGTDPDAIPTPSVAGTYKITLNFKTGKYSVVKQ